MPYFITGKVLGDDGLPLGQIAEVKELTTGANVWTDENTGAYTFAATNAFTMIRISSFGYKPQVMFAYQVPAKVKLEIEFVLEGTTTKPKAKDNSALWLFGLFGGVAALSLLGGKKAPQKQQKAPAATKKPKVIVP